jgi:hypothetical protein
MESKFYYAGLPTAPVLVARSSTTPWEPEDSEVPTSPLEAYRPRRRKVLRFVGDHEAKGFWEEESEINIHALLDSMNIKWTSVDLVRIGYDGDPP